MEITLKNEKAQFEALQKQSNEIAQQCLKLSVVDETTKAIATQNLSKALQIVKQIEEIRVREKKPYKEAGDAIDAFSKALKDPINLAVEAGKKNILAYDKSEREKAAAEEGRILGIKNAIAEYSNKCMVQMDKCLTMDELRDVRLQLVVNAPLDNWGEFLKDFENTRHTLNEYSKSVKTRLLTPEKSDPEETAIIAEAVKEEILAIGATQIAEAIVPKLSGSRKTWKFEVVDFNQIPRDMLILNEALVKEYIAANKETFTDGCIVKGIKYFQHETLTIR
jgi:hypothetical protein